MEENNFFEGKNVYVYKKDASQALLLLIEQMCKGVASGKYGIAVFADLQGAFDAVRRKGQCISCTKQVSLIISQSFPAFLLTDSIYRNLVNSYTSDWVYTTTDVPQGSLLSPFIFLIFTADITLEEPKQTPEIPTESKYADNFEFWRIGADTTNHLLIQTQIAIISLQSWCLKWQMSINISKTNYIIFYDKKKLPPPPSIPVTINGSSITKVKAKRVLGIIIDEDLTFTPHVKHITQKCKMAYNRLTLYADMSPHLTPQLYTAFIRFKLEFDCSVWGFTIHNAKHLKLLESAQRGAASLILKTIKSNPTDGLESELSILPLDVRLEEFQRHEAVKLLIKEDDYNQSKMEGTRHIKWGVLLKA